MAAASQRLAEIDKRLSQTLSEGTIRLISIEWLLLQPRHWRMQRLQDLPPCFRIHRKVEPSTSRLSGPAWFRVYSSLRNATVLTVDGRVSMDLTPILSFYRTDEGVFYHLHPELVTEDEMTLLCDRCLDKVRANAV